MRSRSVLAMFILALACSGLGWAYLQTQTVGASMTDAANDFLETLSDEQLETAVITDFDTPQRLDWHFIPKETRKGLQARDMNEDQRKAAAALLRTGLSEVGYDKAEKIMKLEHILHVLESERNKLRFARDPLRYYVTIFGKPAEEGRWGFSIEGHHLSLNFVVEDGDVVSSTPSFFGANPATVKNDVEGGLPVGTRVLAKEEQIAFDLVNSLSDEQRAKAIIAEEAPSDIRAAGEPQPPQTDPVGIAFTDLSEAQREQLRQLVLTYANNMAPEIRRSRAEAIVGAGPDKVHFAWAGPTEPGIGHYYRIQGPTFLIEFVNTQPDPAGNPANHIHCVWRDMQGDLGIPIGG